MNWIKDRYALRDKTKDFFLIIDYYILTLMSYALCLKTSKVP